jgi:acetylornithine deacetylase
MMMLSPETILKDLVAFPTLTRRQNEELVDYIAGHLRRHGIMSRLFRSADGQRANLIATIGPDRPGGIILSGHTDVVPADTDDWHSDPFAAVIRDGRMFGRGTADMKGFIACILAKVPAFAAARLTRPVHLVFTYDEEIDCLGMRQLSALPELARLQPAAVILGEPTLMRIVAAHRGHSHLETVVRGRQSHGGNAWQGVNAIAVAAGLIGYLDANQDRAHASDPASAALSSSVNIGTVSGGEQFNIVAGLCRFDWEMRPALGADEAAILACFEDHCRAVEALHHERGADLAITTNLLETYAEFGSPVNAPALDLARSLTGLNETQAVGYGTEAPFYQELGFPTVIIGPGSIDQAHQPNEYVELAQLDACLNFLTSLAERLEHETTG